MEDIIATGVELSLGLCKHDRNGHFVDHRHSQRAVLLEYRAIDRTVSGNPVKGFAPFVYCRLEHAVKLERSILKTR
jgi:hypothetical protein